MIKNSQENGLTSITKKLKDCFTSNALYNWRICSSWFSWL